MKGKISTKAIMITILIVVLLAIATTGTVLFLKDSGEAAAMEEQNTIGALPVAGSDSQIEANTEQTVKNEEENLEIVGETEQVETEQQTGETEQNENQAQGTEAQTINTTPTQNTGLITEEPEPTTVEQERVISEETILGWDNLSVSGGEANYTEREINYNNLKYTINYYEDGELVHTEIIKGNSLGKEITKIEDRMKDGYCLNKENTTKLPFSVTENENNNVINIYYEKDENGNGIPDEQETKYSITYVAEGATNIPEKEDNILSGIEKEVSTVVPEKEGYVFTKWATEDVTVEAGKFIMPESNVTFTAVFAKDENGNGIPDEQETKYSIAYVAEGATNIPEKEDNILSGIEKEVSTVVPEKEGYVFTKWTTEDVTVEAGKFIMPEGNVTFTAKFEPRTDIKYTVNYYKENQTIPFNSQTITTGEFGESVTVSVNQINDNKPAGFTFDRRDPVQIVLGTDESNNVLNIYYKADMQQYKVNYYLKDTTTKVAESKIGYAKTETQIKETSKDVTGYDKVGSQTVEIDIKEGENEINFYYTARTDISYTVNYYKNGTTEKLVDSKTVLGKTFKETVTETAKDITGYNPTETAKALLLDKVSENEINFYYTAKTDLSYTVKYFYNGKEDKSKEYTVENQTFGTKVGDYIDKSEGGWTLETAVVPITIGITNNIIEVKYIKPDIVVSKRADKSTVKYNDEITYTIEAVNNGKKEGTVTIKDEPLQTLINEQKVQLVGVINTSDGNKLDVSELAEGAPLNVGAGETENIIFTVKVIANAGDKIVNTIEVENGTIKEDENEVISKIEKTIEIQELTETITGKHIIIAMDRSYSMRGDKLVKEKQAVREFINSVFPNQNTNNGSTVTVIAYTDQWNTYTVGSATNYAQAQDLNGKIDEVYAYGVSDIKDTLEWILNDSRCLGNTTYTNKSDNIVVFIGDGNPEALFSNINKNNIEKRLEPIEQKSIIYVVGTNAEGNGKQRLQFIARNGEYYESSYDGLNNTLKEVTLKINELPKFTKNSENGKVELNSKLYVDSEHPIIINGITYTSMPDKIVLDNGKYYLDLTKFGASEEVSITYYSK